MSGPSEVAATPLTCTHAEAARLLGISPRFLRELVRQDRVPVLRLGRRVLYQRAALEALVAQGAAAERPVRLVR